MVLHSPDHEAGDGEEDEEDDDDDGDGDVSLHFGFCRGVGVVVLLWER